MQATNGEYLTIGQAVAKFAGRGVNRNKLYRWIQRGLLKPYEGVIDKITRVRAEDVEYILDNLGTVIPREDGD